jgi:hypothetical protein
VISYYDLDHLGPDPHFFERQVALSFINLFPNHPAANYPLLENDPAFHGSWIECRNGCKNGTLHLKYFRPFSRLNGSADIDFFRKDIQGITFQANSPHSSQVQEQSFIESLENTRFFEGKVTAFNVKNGFAQPYDVFMGFGKGGASCSSDTTIIHGRKTGEGHDVNHRYLSPGFNLDGLIGQAKITTDLDSYVELCFRTTQSLRRFGAYSTSNFGPYSSCP